MKSDLSLLALLASHTVAQPNLILTSAIVCSFIDAAGHQQKLGERK